MEPAKKTVAVLMGGQSSEHEISIKSGTGVAEALAKGPYEVLPVTITRAGLWAVGGAPSRTPFAALPKLQEAAVDCAFIALHGPYGEDGRVQGMLDMLAMPYTGSGCAASALAMDKVRCKAVVQAQGIRVAGHIALDRPTWQAASEEVRASVRDDIGFPCVIKAPCQGSSKGIEIPREEKQFSAALEQVLAVAGHVMIEEFITGAEVTCSVLDAEDHGKIRALPLTEIRPKNSPYFDYEAKYTPGAAEEITPAPISPQLSEQVMDMACHVHEIVGCAGWSRSDFILDEQGPVWIEVNTVPGLTETSLYPQAALAAGISFEALMALFVEAALRDAHNQDKL